MTLRPMASYERLPISKWAGRDLGCGVGEGFLAEHVLAVPDCQQHVRGVVGGLHRERCQVVFSASITTY